MCLGGVLAQLSNILDWSNIFPPPWPHLLLPSAFPISIEDEDDTCGSLAVLSESDFARSDSSEDVAFLSARDQIQKPERFDYHYHLLGVGVVEFLSS